MRGEAFLHTPQGSLRCRCLDISPSGMSVVSPQAIKARQRVRIDSCFKGQRLVLEALVIRRSRSRDGHVLGVRFEGLAPAAKQQLEEVLRSMQVQATLAQQSCGLVDRLPTLQLPDPEPEPQTERSAPVERAPWPEPAAMPQPVASPMPVVGTPMPAAMPVPGAPMPVAPPMPAAAMPMPAGRMPRPRVATPMPAAGMPRPVAASPMPSVAPTLPPPIAPDMAEAGPSTPWWDALEVPSGRRPGRAVEASSPRWDSTMVAPSPVHASAPSEASSPRWDSTMVAPSPVHASAPSEASSPRWDSTMVAPSPVHGEGVPPGYQPVGLDEGWTEDELVTTHYRPGDDSVPPPAAQPRPSVRAQRSPWAQPARAKPSAWAEAAPPKPPTRAEPTMRTEPPTRVERTRVEPRRVEPTMRTEPPTRVERTRVEPPPTRRERAPTLETVGLDVDLDVSDIEVPDAIDCTEVEAKVGTIDVTEAPLPDWEPGAPVALAELVDTDAGSRVPAPSFDEVWEQLELDDAPPPRLERTLHASLDAPSPRPERTLNTSFDEPPAKLDRTMVTESPAMLASFTTVAAAEDELAADGVPVAPARSGDTMVIHVQDLRAAPEEEDDDEDQGEPAAEWPSPIRTGETLAIHLEAPRVAPAPIPQDELELELPELTAPMTAPVVPRLSDELQAALDRLRRRDDREPEPPPVERRAPSPRRHKRTLGATGVHATTRREDTQIRALYHAALVDLGEPDRGDGS